MIDKYDYSLINESKKVRNDSDFTEFLQNQPDSIEDLQEKVNWRTFLDLKENRETKNNVKKIGRSFVL